MPVRVRGTVAPGKEQNQGEIHMIGLDFLRLLR
jgi:hypothetical protein